MLRKYTLKNGIPVFIVPTRNAPVVSIQAWIGRGSVYESEKVAGVSHFLEHALFKGTKRRKVGEIAKEIESRGGEVNAFTSFEETAYYTTMASRYFEDGLDVIADALQAPAFDPDEMAREREVILEEIKRAHDSPYKMVSYNLWKTCFPETPYGRPVLGYEETVRKIDHKVLREYFNRHYHAGTTSLFIVGDVDEKKALAKAQAFFGKMKGGKGAQLPTLKPAKRPKAPQIISLQRDINECHLQLAFPAFQITHGSTPMLDLACSALGQGESSRLYQRLVKETHLALDAHMGLVATGRCGLATIGLTTSPDKVEAALRETMNILSDTMVHGLNDTEIERVKSSLESDIVAGKETVEGYARRLGYYYIQFGEPDYEKKYLDAVLAVDQTQASEALKGVLGSQPILSLAHPKNTSLDSKALAIALKAPTIEKRVVETAAAILPKLAGKAPVRIISKRVDSLPIVALRFIFRGGSREEAKHQHGIATLFQRVWTSGTRSFNALQISQALESLGASLHGFAGKNTHGLSLEFLPKHWTVIKPLLSEILLHPTFPSDEFATEKNLQMREILSERDTPGSVCNLNFIAALYGDHPNGRSGSGTLESVGKILPEHLNVFYKDYVHQKNVVVSTVGHYPKDGWIAELEALCSQLPAHGRELHKVPGFPVQKGLRVVSEKKQPLFQSHVLTGFLGASFQDPERYALKLLSSCLSGQGGRLFLELRDKQSLAYTVSPLCNDGLDGGLFGFYIGCGPEKLEKALKGIRTQIERLLQTPIPAKELERAKRYWIGRFELDLQRFGAQAMLYGLDEIYGMGYNHSLSLPDKIRSLTSEELMAAARKFLKVDDATFSIVHPEPVSDDLVREAWTV